MLLFLVALEVAAAVCFPKRKDRKLPKLPYLQQKLRHSPVHHSRWDYHNPGVGAAAAAVGYSHILVEWEEGHRHREEGHYQEEGLLQAADHPVEAVADCTDWDWTTY